MNDERPGKVTTPEDGLCTCADPRCVVRARNRERQAAGLAPLEYTRSEMMRAFRQAGIERIDRALDSHYPRDTE